MPDVTQQDRSNDGTARLTIVTLATLVTIAYAASLDYSLPLYFGALNESAALPGNNTFAGTWSALWKYQQTMWIVGPFLGGLLTRRFGERFVWGGSLIGSAMIPFALVYAPTMGTIRLLALWLGLTASLKWIAGISLIQMVAPEKKGLSNGLMMASLGVGSIAGAFSSRALLYRRELVSLIAEGEPSACLARLFGLTPMTQVPTVAEFEPIFWSLVVATSVCGLVVAIWGQRPGRYRGVEATNWRHTFSDVRRLARNGKFWALVFSLCILGGPVFAMANQFLPYRAEALGLKSGAEDHGWIWLQLLRTVMWIPGGIAVGFVAGRRAPGTVGVAMLAAFSLAALGIGSSELAWQLFLTVALFEFSRQFMRWSNSGYLSEHLAENLRATAIGCSITLAGISGTICCWLADSLWSPNYVDFDSSTPFIVAAFVGLLGSAALLAYDRYRPIRDDALKVFPSPDVVLLATEKVATEQ